MADELWIVKETEQSILKSLTSGSSSGSVAAFESVTKEPVFASGERGARAAAFNAEMVRHRGEEKR